MIEYNLEGRKMTDKDRATRHIAHRFEVPESSIYNLDDVWDTLMRIRKTTVIHLSDADIVPEQLGQFGEELIRTLKDAAKANSKIILDLDD